MVGNTCSVCHSTVLEYSCVTSVLHAAGLCPGNVVATKFEHCPCNTVQQITKCPVHKVHSKVTLHRAVVHSIVDCLSREFSVCCIPEFLVYNVCKTGSTVVGRNKQGRFTRRATVTIDILCVRDKDCMFVCEVWDRNHYGKSRTKRDSKVAAWASEKGLPLHVVSLGGGDTDIAQNVLRLGLCNFIFYHFPWIECSA